MKLSQAIEGFFLTKELGFSPNTVRNYRWAYRILIEFLGDVEIETVTSDDIRRFLKHLATKRKLSKRSVHDFWVPLSSLWTWVEGELGISHIIRGRVPQPKFTRKVVTPFTQEEIKRLIDAVEHIGQWTTRGGRRVRSKRPTAQRDKAVILTLVDTGIRATELCDLTLADFDNKNGRLRIQHGKGDKERYVVLGNAARRALWKYLTTRADARPTDPLFATREGQAMRRDNLRHLVDRAGKNAGIENAHPHKFRHTFAINFLRNGGNVMLLKELLGHESLVMVMHYARIAEQDMASATKHSVADNWKL